jgi:ribonuclease J
MHARRSGVPAVRVDALAYLSRPYAAAIFAKRLPVEDEQDRADDEDDRLIDRTGDRQEAERDQAPERFRDTPVASEDLHGMNHVAHLTPWLVDHSGFDAYALLVEAGGRRLLYTGDLRAHGRKSRTIEALARGARGVDVVLLEGTRIGRGDAASAAQSERDVEASCADTFRAADGMALVFYSPQNVDRLVTLYRATKRAGRTFVIDLYTASVAAATGRDTIPQAGWENVPVYLPHSQRRRVIHSREFERTDAVKAKRIYPEELRARRGDIVLTCRGSMLGELEEADCLEGAIGIWSMWPGYLKRPSGLRIVADLSRLGVSLTVEHASGHASPADLEQFAHKLGAGRVVPIHTQGADRFESHFANVVRYPDGEWWDV